MKRVSTFILALFVALQLTAQPKEVTLVVTGEGATKEDATNNALRSAVEQAFGVFVSASTEILNDDIIKDEIATISSGNVKSFKEIAYLESPSGEINITLQVVVSIGKLITYAQNHGSSTEFAGSTFAANIRLMELNRLSTQQALLHLYQVLPRITSSMYDYNLDVKDPVFDGLSCDIEMTVEVLANNHTKEVGDYFFQSLKALAISDKEIRNNSDGSSYCAYYFHSFKPSVRSNNLVLGTMQTGGGSRAIPSYSHTRLRPERVKTDESSLLSSLKQPYYFYGPVNKELINRIFFSPIFSYEISDNLGNKYSIPEVLPELYDHVTIPATRGGGLEADFDRISPYRILLTGVYSIDNSHDVSSPNTLGIINASLINDSELSGIITSNTDYRPGEVIYSFNSHVKIGQEKLKHITGFTISPKERSN